MDVYNTGPRGTTGSNMVLSASALYEMYADDELK